MSDLHEDLAKLAIGDQFESVYWCADVVQRTAVNGRAYCDLTLSDRSGTRKVRMWSAAPVVGNCFVATKGHVEEYQNLPQVIVEHAEAVDLPEEEIGNFRAVSPTFDTDYTDLTNMLRMFVSDVPDGTEEVRTTLNRLLNGCVFTSVQYEVFSKAPGGTYAVDGCIGGLLAQTCRVVKACMVMADLYGFDVTEKAILFAGAVLHRLGAMDCYAFHGCTVKELPIGLMTGVEGFAYRKVQNIVRIMKAVDAKKQKEGQTVIPVDDATVERVEHLVLSSHDRCVRPATREAVLLAEMRRVDVKLVETFRFIGDDSCGVGEVTQAEPAYQRRYVKTRETKKSE